jgi:hypothetical protein
MRALTPDSRFLFASRPGIMGQVLGLVYRVIAGHLIKQAGVRRQRARTGAVTLIQRLGSALNLNLRTGAVPWMATPLA